jgi:hypothetical protein
MKEAAAQAGVTPRSVRRWLAGDQDFIRMVREHRTTIFGQAVGKLTVIGGQAADTLAELLGHDQPPGIRLRAASAILQHLAPGYQALEERRVLEVGEKVLLRSKQLDGEWQELKAAQRRLDDEWLKLRSNGAGGPYGQGR